MDTYEVNSNNQLSLASARTLDLDSLTATVLTQRRLRRAATHAICLVSTITGRLDNTATESGMALRIGSGVYWGWGMGHLGVLGRQRA